MTHKKQSRLLLKLGCGIGVAAVLFILGLNIGRFYQFNHAVSATISLDVNPSIEIAINAKEEVLSVTPRNEDAQKVIGNMDFTGSSLEVTMNALVGSMLRNGYLNESTNSILISVDNDDPAKGTKLQEKLTKDIEEILQNESFHAAVLSQTVRSDETLASLAEHYGITPGKAQLIQDITAAGNTHSFEELASLSVNELNLLAHSSHTHLEHVESAGTASDKAYIGEEKALEAALKHAGLARNNITKLSVELDYEHHVMVYDIEFDCDGYEYDYEVHAVNGSIVKNQKELDDHQHHHTSPSTTPSETLPSAAPAETASAPPVETGSAAPVETGSAALDGTSYIGEAKAKAIALAHANVTESSVSKLQCELDREYGYICYEVEFDCMGWEYEYEIDAFSGAILKQKKEVDD